MSRRARRAALVVGLVAGFLVLVIGGPAQAADDLEWDTELVYRLKVDEGALNVVSTVELTNHKPSTTSGNVVTRYYFDRVAVFVPVEAEGLTATSDGETLRTELAQDPEASGLLIATIHLPRHLFYSQSVTITIDYDIPGDEPRSESTFRINPAYASFGVIAWGDPGNVTVKVILDDRFTVDTFGDQPTQSREDGQIVYTVSNIEDPDAWFMYFTARDDSRLTTTSAALADIDIAIRAWPNDRLWAGQVTNAVETGLPILTNLVGLPWQPEGTLDLLESIEPNLLGYGGWFLDTSDVIEIGEFVDPHLVLHELAHSWFNDDLFEGRWIDEGLADTFAQLAVAEMAAATHTDFVPPELPIRRHSTFALPLNDWAVPNELTQANQKREDYGYTDSWWLVHELTTEIGTENMAAVLAAAANDEIAYRASDPPEQVAPTDDWRRFLDLLEEVGGSKTATTLFTEWVVADDQALAARTTARDTYTALVLAAGNWDIPLLVREPMGEWNFDEAQTLMAAAMDVLDTRDQILMNVATVGAVMPDDLEQRFETSTKDFTAARALADDALDAIDAVIAAKAAVDDDHGLLQTIGLIGAHPEDRLGQAVAAFDNWDLAAAQAQAAHTIAIIDDAASAGTTRVTGAAVALLVVTGAGLILVRRARRRPAPGSPDLDHEPPIA